MSTRTQQLVATIFVSALSLATTGCKWNPFGERSHEVIDIAQVPGPVKATIDRQADGLAVGEIEKQTANGRTRYEVTMGSGADKKTVLIGEDGRQLADDDEDED